MALRLKANRRFPSIPVVVDTSENHTQVLMAVKEALDIGQRRTGDLLNSFIRVEDLIDLGLITIEGNTSAIVGADLSEIANIGDLSGAALGDFLRFDGTDWVNDQLANTDITQAMVVQHQAALSIAWSQITGEPTIPEEINDLTDVNATPIDGDVLTWDSGASQWVAAAPSGGSMGYLDDLLDVDAPYPSSGDVLTWDGYGWVNEQPTSAGGFTFVGAAIASGAVTDLTVSGLDIDTDGTYFVQVDLLGASAGTANLSSFFNGDTTATNYERMLVTNGSAVSADNAIFGGLPNTTPGRWEGWITRNPSGRVIFNHQGGRIDGAGSLSQMGTVIWDTSANLTSLTVNSSVASQLASGSRLRVWRVPS